MMPNTVVDGFFQSFKKDTVLCLLCIYPSPPLSQFLNIANSVSKLVQFPKNDTSLFSRQKLSPLFFHPLNHLVH